MLHQGKGRPRPPRSGTIVKSLAARFTRDPVKKFKPAKSRHHHSGERDQRSPGEARSLEQQPKRMLRSSLIKTGKKKPTRNLLHLVTLQIGSRRRGGYEDVSQEGQTYEQEIPSGPELEEREARGYCKTKVCQSCARSYAQVKGTDQGNFYQIYLPLLIISLKLPLRTWRILWEGAPV